MGFMKLMKFICKENSVGRYLGMTVTIVTVSTCWRTGNGFQKDILTAYYLPAGVPGQPALSQLTQDITILKGRLYVSSVGRSSAPQRRRQSCLRSTCCGRCWAQRGDASQTPTWWTYTRHENPGVSCREERDLVIRRDPKSLITIPPVPSCII
ncbi:hypothetical protein J4Q44_G00283390, partial [Coregonus suidteri]